jgi:hypothetical protein
MAQDHRHEVQSAERRSQVELTEDELHLIVGGAEDPIKPIGGIGENGVDRKATPILM